MIILGIDPGTATTGYGVLKTTNLKTRTRIDCLAHGLIETSPDKSFPDRLKKISRDLDILIKKHQPGLIAIESVFFFRNLKTFVPVNRAMGVIILGAAKKKIPIMEFTPLQVKLIVANYGHADKKDVQKRITKLLRLKALPKPDDVADALGVALCGALSLTGRH
jgi:crossover junction endodeoxyribonuclease RuvC